ncbi:Hsp20/alpha crystallin family protein [Pseudoramibacter sp.]|jgi:HSP20 family molecular chaperone IbpA|uniref:Hsp20/alpha crystallin family protein n=1 Tax=Pseudoramibacter sp. TaxID=2034862 RepID=UPI00345A954C
MLPSVFGENLFDELMNTAFDDGFLRNVRRTDMMKTDVKESDDGYQVAVDLPGFTKDDVTVKLENGNLIISAETKKTDDKKNDKGEYVRRERYSGSCTRSFYVGNALKKDDIKASMNDGVLKIAIPKKDQKAVDKAQQIMIEG